MKTDSLMKLAESGNVRDTEDHWLASLDHENDMSAIADRAPVLTVLAGSGHEKEAETLATATVDWVIEQHGPEAALPVATAYLLELRKSQALRESSASLYRQVYADVDNLEALMKEAGIEGGRPPRRAVRTMDVSLAVQPGMYMTHRHESTAARVEKVDTSDWEITLETADGEESFNCVEAADNYAPADDNDYRVLRQFDPDALIKLLQDDPASVILNIAQQHSRGIDSDTLESILSPEFIPAKTWTKWWTKARQAVRLNPNLILEGRSPYYITFDPRGQTFEQEIEQKLKKTRDPAKELGLAEEYVRGCKARNQEHDPDLLVKIRDRIEERARRHMAKGGKINLTVWLIAARIRELLGEEDPYNYVREIIGKSSDPVALIQSVDDESFWLAACEALEQVHPANLREALEKLLPHAPVAVADHLASKMVELEEPKERFAEIADRILKDPVECNAGLRWLWNGPSEEQARPDIPLATVFTRLLFALGELKRQDDIPAARRRQIISANRDIIRARRYDRFHKMLDEVEPGVANAMATEIRRLDSLGQAATDDLMRFIREKFPVEDRKPEVPRWQQEGVIWVTGTGMERRRREIENLHVKLKENAEAIGKAAAHGDLSENSEYKFALEERDLLRARLAQLNKEMDIAQKITETDVPTDHVGIGCKVRIEHTTTGDTRELTILSPFEADLDKGIYNYQSPLAQHILGQKLNQTVTLEFLEPSGEYRISLIESAL